MLQYLRSRPRRINVKPSHTLIFIYCDIVLKQISSALYSSHEWEAIDLLSSSIIHYHIHLAHYLISHIIWNALYYENPMHHSTPRLFVYAWDL